MDDTISRQAAIDVVRDVMLDFIEYEDEIEVPMADTDKQLFSIKKAISKRIKALPSVDAVPVVRCKNCAYHDEVDEHELWCMGNGYPARLVTPDEYCSKAVRR